MSKPSEISEVQWAKRGWTCVGREKVGCVGGCGNELVLSLVPEAEEDPEDVSSEDYVPWRENARKELVAKYEEMIVTEHEEGCLWRRKGCDGTLLISGYIVGEFVIDATR